MNEYQTVYVYQPSGIEIVYYFIFLTIALLGLGMALLIKKTFKKYSLLRQVAIFYFGFMQGGIGIIFLVVLLINTPIAIKDQKKLKNLIENKGFDVAEGLTANYLSKLYGGNEMITFSVNEIKFEYFDYIIQKEYQHASNIANPITSPITRNGQKVRISYTKKDNEIIILKIEVNQ